MVTPTTINPIKPTNAQAGARPEKAAPRFGFAGGGLVQGVDRVMSTIQKSRTREMLIEDLVGFGFLRTGMDLFRQYMFEKTEDGQRQLNLPAARERTIREIGSIFTDNFSGGIIAAAIAWAAGKWGYKTLSNDFMSHETLGLFQQVAKNSASQEAFVQNLAKTITPQASTTFIDRLRGGVNCVVKEGYENTAVNLARLLNPNARTLDATIKVAGEAKTFALDGLVEDAARFAQRVGQNLTGGKSSWQATAQNLLTRTVRMNNWRLPISLGLAMAMTMAMPYLNRYITRKVDGIDSYPGEMGLRQMQEARAKQNTPWTERLFPYLSQSIKKLNPLPLLATLIPLPFALGLFDTVKLSNGSISAAFNNPLKLGFKGYLGKMASLLQFGKGFPFTTQQQMASCFAFLIFSRLATARSDIEFRERMVDSFLGWGIWILATPRLKKLYAQWRDGNLLKQVGGMTVLKRRIEIERLMPPALRQNTLSRFILMSAACLGITIAMLGIVEPYLAIKWTERQARRDESKGKAKASSASQSRPMFTQVQAKPAPRQPQLAIAPFSPAAAYPYPLLAPMWDGGQWAMSSLPAQRPMW